MKLADTGSFGQLDLVYVSGTYEACSGTCSEDFCFIENIIEPCIEGCGSLQLETDPAIPDTTLPVKVTIKAYCGDTCFEVCDVAGEWISSSQYHIDWYIRDTSGCQGCSDVATLYSSDIDLGVLPSGDYTITSSMYIKAPCDAPCLEGQLQHEHAELSFHVGPPIPAASSWGLIIMGLLLLVTATILLRRRAYLFVLCCCITLLLGTANAQQPDLSAPHHPEHLLVRFKPGTPAQERATIHAGLGATLLKSYRYVEGLTLIKVPAAGLKNALGQYLNNPNVLYAEPDYHIHLDAVPDDPEFSKLWGLQNIGQTVNGDSGTANADIDAPEAWDVWIGDPNFRIAVIDTGIAYTHEDLLANIWTNPLECPGGIGNCIVNGVDEDNNGYFDDFHGFDFGDNDNDPFDLDNINWHGTHVAGTIGAVGDNSIGVVGVNQQCKLVALKIFGGGFTEEELVSAAIAAMEYVIANDIKVSNNSWSVEIYSQGLHDVIQASQAIGHIFVTSAGNEKSNLDGFLQYPQRFDDLDNIITVTNTDNDDCLAVWPGFGGNIGPNSVDLGAPGLNTYSTTEPNVDPSQPDYNYLNGTSMASPHVAGVVALIMSQNPSMTWQQVKDRVLSTVRPIPALTGLTVTGGVVNAPAALWDCNTNGVLDDLDISGGTSSDCNNNGVPDECEPDEDCQQNGIQDICDIASGFSEDCNGNSIPDDCELDSCGIPLPQECGSGDCCTDHGTRGCNCTACYEAVCKLNPYCCYGPWDSFCFTFTPFFPVCDCNPQVTTPRNDCNENGVLDECEPQEDCNGTITQDICDIAFGTSDDCNCNSIPDECDIASGTSADINSNGIPDECDAIDGACCLSGVPCDLDTSCSCTARGGTFMGVSSKCNTLPTGACCLGSSCQSDTTQCECLDLGGTFLGESTTCDTGACCFGSSCQANTTQCECLDGGGNYQGDGSVCRRRPPPSCSQYFGGP